MKFIVRLEGGESMSSLCREFGISRKTGYKLKKRYEEIGVDGFRDLSRRPRGHPHQIPRTKIDVIVAMRERYGWGPVKLRRVLDREYPDQLWPANSTIGLILKREGLITSRKTKRRAKPTGLPVEASNAPNELWTIDFKGHFRMGNSKYCYPLTLCDHYSRYLLCCEALPNTRTPGVKDALTVVFRNYGLPSRIRSDNGAPFASTNKLGLTKLAVWFMRHGIQLERIAPGRPDQNGRHERMHKTLKASTTKPPEQNLLRQQERFDDFVTCYNRERPHAALELDTPQDHYSPSAKPYELPEIPLSYPQADTIATVYKDGNILLKPIQTQFFVGSAFAGERLGISKLSNSTWIVHFASEEIGYLDVKTRQFLVDLPPELRTEAKHRGKV